MVPTVWSRWVWPILTGRTRHVAVPVAAVVGTLLLAVNQGSRLMSGDLDVATILRAVANYAIPYVVSSVGLISGHDSPPAAQEASAS
jgi:hypothetical protein